MFFLRKMKIIITFIFMIIIFLFLNSSLNLRIAICAISRRDNLYIKEFIDYYLLLGVDHIFIYDLNNNTKNISDIFEKTYILHVTICDNIIKNESTVYNTCYQNNKKKFDWIFMNYIDEFLIIKNNTLKNYLYNKIFKDCHFIGIHRIQTTDNNLLYYDRRPLMQRFKGPYLKDNHIKIFVRGNIKDMKYDIYSLYSSPIRDIVCNNIGQKYNYNQMLFNSDLKINYDKAFIIHFKYKSTEENINKYKTNLNNSLDHNFLLLEMEEYFKNNDVTLEKIDLIEKELKLNLSKYKKIKPKNKIIEKSSNILNNIHNNNHLKQNYISNLKKNLLIGSISNLNWEIIEPFFVSFKNSEFEKCDCIMFATNIQSETIHKIESFGVVVNPIPNKYKKMKLVNYRWKIYEDFLNENIDKYNLVFTADVRDTIFQKDVFKYYENQKSFLGIALEDGTLSTQPLNKKWIIDFYGEELMKIIGNERIICLGTLWGTIDKFSQFSKIIWEKLNSEWSSRLKVVDQPVGNALIYNDKMFNECLVKSENKDGPIMTIGITNRENINLDSENNILNGNGEIAAVVHQYDRMTDILEKIRKKYSLKINNINPAININIQFK